jgi:hypothetical protein
VDCREYEKIGKIRREYVSWSKSSDGTRLLIKEQGSDAGASIQ